MTKKIFLLPMFKILLIVVVALITFLYPFAVYAALGYNKVSWVIFILIGALVLRTFIGGRKNLLINICLLTVASVVAIWYAISNSQIPVLCYPVLINLIFLGLFSFSLFKGKTPIIEVVASLTTPKEQRTEFFKKYCRGVTIAWVIFFIVNGLIALGTVLYGNWKIWTLYNGFISYLLMGAMFAIEFVFRNILRKKDRSKS